MNYKRALMAAAGSMALLVAACETTGTGYEDDSAESARVAELERQLEAARSQNSSLSTQVTTLQTEVSTSSSSYSSSSSSYDSIAASAGYPPNARAGQCFSRILIPEITETTTEQVIDQPMGTELRIIGATYDPMN